MSECTDNSCKEEATEIGRRGSEEIPYCKEHLKGWNAIMEALGVQMDNETIDRFHTIERRLMNLEKETEAMLRHLIKLAELLNKKEK